MNFVPIVGVQEMVSALEGIEFAQDYSALPTDQRRALFLLRMGVAYQAALVEKLNAVVDDVVAKCQQKPLVQLDVLLESLADVLGAPVRLNPDLATPEVLKWYSTEYQHPVSIEDMLKNNPSLQSSLDRAAKIIKDLEGEDDVPTPA